MNVFKKLLIFFLFFSYTSISNSNEKKIVFMDVDLLLLNSDIGKKITSNIEKFNFDNLNILEKKRNKIKEEENKLEKQKNIISKEEFSKNYNSLKKSINEYNIEKNQIFEKLKNKKNEELTNFFTMIDPIIKEYMNANSINLIFDKKNIFIGRDNIDITNDILERINKNLN